jgi:hypothetical protein
MNGMRRRCCFGCEEERKLMFCVMLCRKRSEKIRRKSESDGHVLSRQQQSSITEPRTNSTTRSCNHCITAVTRNVSSPVAGNLKLRPTLPRHPHAHPEALTNEVAAFLN